MEGAGDDTGNWREEDGVMMGGTCVPSVFSVVSVVSVVHRTWWAVRGPRADWPCTGRGLGQAVRRPPARQASWRQVRERLVVLHRLLHEDATILPLWQTIEHFAYRRTLQGLSANRLSLYQDFEQWRRAPALARSQP